MSSRGNDSIGVELILQPGSTNIREPDFEADGQESQTATRGQEFSLPEADGGKEAWLFLAGCFMVEAMVWGAFLHTNGCLFALR